MKVTRFVKFSVLASMTTFLGLEAMANDVTVYSYRQEFLMEPLLKAFEAESGYKVNFLYAGKGLSARLEQEGKNSPADVLLTADIGRADEWVKKGLTQPIDPDVLKLVPANFRHPDGLWAAQTTRARVIYASVDRVAKGSIETWDDLLDPKYKGKVCIRDGKNAYNLGLWASFIVNHGQAYTTDYLTKLKANLARKPQGNDRAQAKAIWQGECDVAIANSYYMGKMIDAKGKDAEQNQWAAASYIIFPNQADKGTHVNVSTAAIAKYAPHKEAANALIAFLLSDKAQKMYADVNYEHPVNPDIEYSDLLKTWGQFKAETLSLQSIADERETAMKLVDQVRFND